MGIEDVSSFDPIDACQTLRPVFSPTEGSEARETLPKGLEHLPSTDHELVVASVEHGEALLAGEAAKSFACIDLPVSEAAAVVEVEDVLHANWT